MKKKRKDELITLLNSEWQDIRHSRMQEWTALGVVTGSQIAILQIQMFIKEMGISLPTSKMAIAGSVLGIFFSIIGAIITCHHRKIMNNKIKWIFASEFYLGLVKKTGNVTAENKLPKDYRGIIPDNVMESLPMRQQLALPPLCSTSCLILMFYILFIIFNLILLISCLFVSAEPMFIKLMRIGVKVFSQSFN